MAVAKSGFLAGLLSALIGPLAAIVAQWVAIRAGTTHPKLRAKKTTAMVLAWILVVGAAVAGESAMGLLERHFGWSDRTGFAAMAGYWTFWVVATLTWSLVETHRGLSRRLQSKGSGETPRPPMTPGALAVFVGSLYLTICWWLIRLAWLAHDRVTAGIIAGTILVLSGWHLSHVRGRTGAAATRTHLGHLALAGATIAVIFNLRFGVWLACAHGVSVAEMHRLRPLWRVPLLTSAVVLWTGAVWVLTRPKRRSRRNPAEKGHRYESAGCGPACSGDERRACGRS